MTDRTYIIGIAIATIPGMLAALSSFRNSKKIDEVHQSTNSRLDQLLKASEAKFHAKGMADQRALDAKHAGFKKAGGKK